MPTETNETDNPAASNTLPNTRLTPDDLRNIKPTGNAGSASVHGAEEVTVLGDPGKPGMYVQLLKCGPHMKIPAHHHQGDRIATVLSGSWSFGYGPTYDPAELQHLPVGSIYTERHRSPHFAQVGDEMTVVQITGYGPTDTVFVNPDEDPRKK